jgi:hypothetical protein
MVWMLLGAKSGITYWFLRSLQMLLALRRCSVRLGRLILKNVQLLWFPCFVLNDDWLCLKSVWFNIELSPVQQCTVLAFNSLCPHDITMNDDHSKCLCDARNSWYRAERFLYIAVNMSNKEAQCCNMQKRYDAEQRDACNLFFVPIKLRLWRPRFVQLQALLLARFPAREKFARATAAQAALIETRYAKILCRIVAACCTYTGKSM